MSVRTFHNIAAAIDWLVSNGMPADDDSTDLAWAELVDGNKAAHGELVAQYVAPGLHPSVDVGESLAEQFIAADQTSPLGAWSRAQVAKLAGH